jgi:hypothetical protein
VGHNSENILRATGGTLSASAANEVLSKPFKVSAEDARGLTIDFFCVGVGGTVTAKLQTSHDGSTWVTANTATLTGTGTVTLKLLDTVTADQTHLPLRPIGRIVYDATTGSGSVSAIWRSRKE